MTAARSHHAGTTLLHLLVAALAVARAVTLAAPPSEGALAAGGPVFNYDPRAVPPGMAIAASGARFGSATAAALSLISASGDLTTIGITPIVQGGFNRSFTIPSSFAPGRYFVFVNDAQGRIAINLKGSLTVPAPGRPWFTHPPTTPPFPGGAVEVAGYGFPHSSTAAVFGLVDPAGQITALGAAPLTLGTFVATFPLPSALAAGTYYPFLRDASQPLFAQNVDGPLAVTAVAPPAEIPVGFYPVGAAVNVLSNRVFVPNAGDDTLSVLDGQAGAAVGVVPVGALPCAVGSNGLTNRVYVANVNSNDVSVVNGSTLAVVGTIPVGRYPCAVAVLPGLNRVFVGNYGESTVSVIDASAGAVIATLPTGRGPFGLAANPLTNRVYVVNGYDNTLSVVDGAALGTIATIPVGATPDAVAVSPSTNRIYVANFFGNSVTVLDGATHALLATIAVGREPDAIAIDWASNRVYVSNYSSNTVSVIDGDTQAVTTTIPVGQTPDGLAANPFDGRVYVTNSNSRSVSVIEGPIR